jgi:surface polysaccharide O-acyltransferase-like enzyme
MVAVVCLHCTRAWTLTGPNDNRASYAAATLCKFGTIGFFLVSGFLLQESLAGRTSLSVLRRRIDKVALPWLAWFVFSLAVFFADDWLQHRSPHGAAVGAAMRFELARLFTATSLWFVPNLFICLAVLLIFRRYLHRLALGAALLLVNLGYVVNIYRQWIPALHSEALFGFVFYLWLGHYAAIHRGAFARLLVRLRWPSLLAATTLMAFAAFGEARLLLETGKLDPLNTLRLSNQLFSILVVLCLAKLERATWPRFVDVPRHTFGIYLSHSLIVALVLTCARRLIDTQVGPTIAAHGWLRAGLWLVLTAMAWSAGWLCARVLAGHPAWQWLVGLGHGRSEGLPGVAARPAFAGAVAHPRR